MLAGQVGDEYTVIGDTVNVAARLQAAARPGSVTVGESDLPRHPATTIDYEELEPLALKGKAEPVPAWGASGVVSRPVRRAAPRAPRRR